MKILRLAVLGLVVVSLVLGLSTAAQAGEVTVQFVRAVQYQFGLFFATVGAYGTEPLSNVTLLVNEVMLTPDSVSQLPISQPSSLYPNQTLWRITKRGIVLKGGDTLEVMVHNTNDGEGTRWVSCQLRFGGTVTCP